MEVYLKHTGCYTVTFLPVVIHITRGEHGISFDLLLASSRLMCGLGEGELKPAICCRQPLHSSTPTEGS